MFTFQVGTGGCRTGVVVENRAKVSKEYINLICEHPLVLYISFLAFLFGGGLFLTGRLKPNRKDNGNSSTQQGSKVGGGIVLSSFKQLEDPELSGSWDHSSPGRRP